MKKLGCVLFLLFPLYLQGEESPASKQNKDNKAPSSNMQTPSEDHNLEDLLASTINPPAQTAHQPNPERSGLGEDRGILIIPPEKRAQDIKQAFHYLQTTNPTVQVEVKLANGMILKPLDMELMEGGTMFIFRLNSIKGHQFQLVKVEDIDTMMYGSK